MQWEGTEEEGPRAGLERRLPPDRRNFTRGQNYEEPTPTAEAPVDAWEDDEEKEDLRDDIDDLDDDEDDILAELEGKDRWSTVKQGLQSTWMYTLVQFVVVLVMQLLTRACVNSFLHSR